MPSGGDGHLRNYFTQRLFRFKLADASAKLVAVFERDKNSPAAGSAPDRRTLPPKQAGLIPPPPQLALRFAERHFLYVVHIACL